MAKKNEIIVRDVSIKTLKINGEDYLCITDIARQKNSAEPKDVVKNWMRQKNTLEYLGLWERLHNPNFKGVEFDPLLTEAGSNSFTMSPTRWIDLTAAIGIVSKSGAGGGTYAHSDIATRGKTNQTQSDSHPADAGFGRQQWQEIVEVSLFP